MKFISLFLSVFFTFLVTVPCNDEIASYGEDSSVSVEKNNDEHSNFDACSIFCTCSCCGVVKISDTKFAELTGIPTEKIYFKISDFQKNLLLQIPFDIWQPPKLS